jgi:hypothetical protein
MLDTGFLIFNIDELVCDTNIIVNSLFNFGLVNITISMGMTPDIEYRASSIEYLLIIGLFLS